MKFDLLLPHILPYPLLNDTVLFGLLGPGASSRNMLSRWCQEGRLLRLKRGLYLLSTRYKPQDPALRFQIANTIVTPSFVSCETALAFHGLIPELIAETTSISFSQMKVYSNPLGCFSYRRLPPHTTMDGVDSVGTGMSTFLIASKERALIDTISLRLRGRMFHPGFLLESLRIEEEDLEGFDFDKLSRFAEHFRSRKLNDAAKKMRRHYGA